MDRGIMWYNPSPEEIQEIQNKIKSGEDVSSILVEWLISLSQEVHNHQRDLDRIGVPDFD
jgi:hypothetical protein